MLSVARRPPGSSTIPVSGRPTPPLQKQAVHDMSAAAGSLLAAEGGSTGFWLPADLNEVYWGSLAFLIVMGLLWKFGRRPIADYFSGRIARISDELEASGAVRLNAEASREQIRTALAGVDNEAARIIHEAHQTAAHLSEEYHQRTAAEIAAIRDAYGVEMAERRNRAEADLSADLAALSLGSAELVVHRSLDPAAQQRLIDGYIDEIRSA